MIEVHFSSVYTYLENVPVSVEEELYSTLSYQPEGYFYSPKFQSNIWDGFIRLYQPKNHRFRSGLLFRVLKFLEERSIEYSLFDFPESSCFSQKSDSYLLRPYQLKVVNDILSTRFGIIQSPPRSGKTMMMIATVDSLREFPAIFFCRSLDLAYQTVDRVREFLPNVKVGLIGDGEVQIEPEGLTVATIQSVYSTFSKKYDKSRGESLERPIEEKLQVRKLLKNAKMIFYDECHHSKGETSKFVLDKCVSASLKIGLSATPFSENDSELLVENVIGPVIHEVYYSDLIKEGFLVAPNIKLYRLPKHHADGTYNSVYKSAVIENEFLEGLILKIVKFLNSKGKSVVIQTEFINHTERLGKVLNCEILTGRDKTDRRLDILNRLKSKELLCLVSTLFEEGLDIPALDFTINAAGGLSNISTLQKMRSMTSYQGKTSCGVVDFYHQCKYLSNHSKIRKSLYEREPEFNLSIIDVSKKTLEEIT